jgi:ATP-dependent RNA helicase RhlE
MGFLRDIERILKYTSKKGKLNVFSFSKDIKKLAMGILHKPVQVEATPENTTVDAITQKSVPCCKREKTELIIKLTEGNWKQILCLLARNKVLIN